MTPDLDELTRLEAAATNGPWHILDQASMVQVVTKHEDSSPDMSVCGMTKHEGDNSDLIADSRFIAALRNAAPELIAAARSQQLQNETRKNHPSMCCGQCVDENDTLRTQVAALMEEIDELTREPWGGSLQSRAWRRENVEFQARLAAQAKTIAELRGLLEDIGYHPMTGLCQKCGRPSDRHEPDCGLARALEGES